GEVESIQSGEFTVEDTIAVIKNKDGDRQMTMIQKWPVRKPRPYLDKIIPDMPFLNS
ncbi:unnamed protein product, partial [marine sediment metagenome]